MTWTNLLFQNNAYYDRLQLHYYGPWQDFRPVTDWVHQKLSAVGATKTLDYWELAYGWAGAPGNCYNPESHAQDLEKLTVTAIGEGADRPIQFEFSSYNDKIG